MTEPWRDYTNPKSKSARDRFLAWRSANGISNAPMRSKDAEGRWDRQYAEAMNRLALQHGMGEK